MDPLLTLSVFLILSPVVLGGDIFSFDDNFSLEPEDSKMYKWFIQKIEDITGKDIDSSDWDLRDIVDILINLPAAILGYAVEQLLSFVNWIFESFYNVLVNINIWLDGIVYKFIVGSSLEGAINAETGENWDILNDIPEEITSSPMWMSWILIKGIIFMFFWIFIIRMLMQVLDIWKFILDILPVV